MEKQEDFPNFIYCSNCGKRNNENSITCWKCGSHFSSFPNKNNIERSKNRSKSVKYILIYLSIVIIIGVLAEGPSLYFEIKGEKVITEEYENGITKEKYTMVKRDDNWLKAGVYISYYGNGKIKE